MTRILEPATLALAIRERRKALGLTQALGVMPERKYQADGGPGFAESAALVRRSCANPAGDLERIVDASAFAAFAADVGVKPALVRERGKRMASLSGQAWNSVAELPDSNAYPAIVASMEAGWLRRIRQLGMA